MGLFGALTLFLSVFPRGRHSQQPLDPEKGTNDVHNAERAHHDSHDQHDLDHDSSDENHEDGNDLGISKPHRLIRRVYSNVTHTLAEPVHSSGSSDDVTLSGSSLYSRIKSYVWPSDDKNADLDSIVPNYRWTPIISGIVIPFSILLEIPGLTERWYIRTENHQTVETRKNPVILEVGLAISMACALIANVALVLRFLEKRVQTVTLLCIVFLTVHDIINIVAVTVFGVEHRFDDGFTYGEAYWMTLCSTIASTITNVSLIVDLIRTPDFSRRGSGLTRKQRALMIIVIVLLVYIAFGALINSILLHLSFINGLYFSVVSIETIGFGDIVPKSTGARVWTCVYILFGVINIGVAIAMCRETILEGLEIGYRRRLRDMRQRRREARRFRRWEARWERAVEFRLREAGLPVWVSDKEEREDDGRVRFLGLLPGVTSRMPFFRRIGTTIKRTATLTSVESRLTGHRGMHLNVNALTNAQLEAAALEAGVPLEMFLDLGDRRKDEHTGQDEDLPARSRSQDGGSGIVPVLARTHAVHAFRDTMASGWPSHAQTPTHAQIGRMAAMLTKFAVAVAGRYAHAPGMVPDVVSEERQPDDEEQGNGDEGRDASEPPRPSVNQFASGASGASGGDDGQRKRRRTSFLDIKKHPAAKWLKDHSRGATQRSAWTYEKFRTEMEAEEKKAYYVKLAIAWILFFLFWTVGSGIFSATEGWPYGSAMYFCFLAFVTTGYGDFAPVTPAGRSVFVVWALFGVGTLTIVVSVLQEASSSRYKSALHSRVFDKAVKKYRKRQIQESKQRPRPVVNNNAQNGNANTQEKRNGHAATSSGQPNGQGDTQQIEGRLKQSQEIAQHILEALPGEIVRGARTFQEYMQFFVSGAVDGANPFDDRGSEDPNGMPTVPPDMKKLLDELAEMEHINERVKSEILQDEDARKTLFMLSLERSLKKLVASAEKALSALADRDALATLAAAQSSSPQEAEVEVRSRAVTPDDDRSGSSGAQSSALPRAKSEPARPLHRRHVRHAPSPALERGTHDDGMSSTSDPEDISSSASSMTAGPS
ncbi:hypothetical protein OH77DRAFT_1555853 [Trametes cingulata]|nr:hypothetical protein OH77DRAFT_1555853 [Trametes cingulata]